MQKLSEFRDWIQDLKLWRYFELKCCLVRLDNSEKWSIGFLWISLLENKKEIIEIKTGEYEHLKLIHKVYDIGSLNPILESLEKGDKVRINGFDASADLLRPEIQSDLFIRSYVRENFGIDEPSYVVMRTGEFSRLRNMRQQIEVEIRKYDPPFESLRDLCKTKFDIDFGTDAFSLFITFLAPLYTKFSKIYIENNILFIVLRLARNIPTSDILLNVFGRNKDGVTILRKTFTEFSTITDTETSTISLDLEGVVSDIKLELNFKEAMIDDWNCRIVDRETVFKKVAPYMNSRRYNDVLAILTKAIDSDPNNHDFLIEVADLLVQIGKYDEGLELYDRVLKNNPQNVQALYKKGLALSDLGKFWEAVEYYRSSLELKPNNPEVWNYLGLAFTDLKKYEDAIKAFDRALELKPNDSYVLNTKGLCIDNLGDHQKALTLYDEALRINPNLAEAWNNKGFVLNGLHKYEDAISSYDKALEINPRDANAWHNKGITFTEIGEYELALKCMDKALELNRYLAPSWYGKAQLLEKLQRYEESVASFEKAESIDPKYSVARSIGETPLGRVQRQADEVKSRILSKIIDPNIANEARRKLEVISRMDTSSHSKVLIDRFQVKNLKSLRETDLLKFKPITLFLVQTAAEKHLFYKPFYY
jgi:tetratricopeptide (TPR) repeat protein